MYVVIGYLILSAESFFSLNSAVATIPIIFFGSLFRQIFSSNTIAMSVSNVLSFLVTYFIIDLVWYNIYEYHLPFLLLAIILTINVIQLNDKKLNQGGFIITQSEIISVILFGLYTFVFVDFNWI